MKNNKFSVYLSALLGIVFLFALVFVSFCVPSIADDLISVPDKIGFRNEISEAGKILVIADIYSMIAVGTVAVLLMFLLLNTVSEGKVFSEKASRLLSAVSICCFIEGFLAFLMVLYFQLALCATLAACFLGLCLRIVKNVIEEATRIKEENDFTV